MRKISSQEAAPIKDGGFSSTENNADTLLDLHYEIRSLLHINLENKESYLIDQEYEAFIGSKASGNPDELLKDLFSYLDTANNTSIRLALASLKNLSYKRLEISQSIKSKEKYMKKLTTISTNHTVNNDNRKLAESLLGELLEFKITNEAVYNHYDDLRRYEYLCELKDIFNSFYKVSDETIALEYKSRVLKLAPDENPKKLLAFLVKMISSPITRVKQNSLGCILWLLSVESSNIALFSSNDDWMGELKKILSISDDDKNYHERVAENVKCIFALINKHRTLINKHRTLINKNCKDMMKSNLLNACRSLKSIFENYEAGDDDAKKQHNEVLTQLHPSGNVKRILTMLAELFIDTDINIQLQSSYCFVALIDMNEENYEVFRSMLTSVHEKITSAKEKSVNPALQKNLDMLLVRYKHDYSSGLRFFSAKEVKPQRPHVGLSSLV